MSAKTKQASGRPTPVVPLTPTELERWYNVNRGTTWKLAKEGKITMKNGKVAYCRVKPHLDLSHHSRLNREMSVPNLEGRARAAKQAKNTNGKKKPPPIEKEVPPDADGETGEIDDLALARATAKYSGDVLSALAKAGELVDKASVQRAASLLVSELNVRIKNLPQKFEGKLASELGIPLGKATDFLRKMSTDLLKEIATADLPERFGAEIRNQDEVKYGNNKKP